MTTPFLSKLRELCCSCPIKVAAWSSDGSRFEVYNSDSFEELLGIYFKGSSKTFIRQLHFYSFSKQDMTPGKWCFFHPQFSRDNLDGIFTITRKTRKQETSFATTEDVGMLQNELRELESSIGREISQLSSELQNLARTFRKNLESSDSVLIERVNDHDERLLSPSMLELGFGSADLSLTNQVQLEPETNEMIMGGSRNSDEPEQLDAASASLTAQVGTQEPLRIGVEAPRGFRGAIEPAVKIGGSSPRTSSSVHLSQLEQMGTGSRHREHNIYVDVEGLREQKRQRRDSDISNN